MESDTLSRESNNEIEDELKVEKCSFQEIKDRADTDDKRKIYENLVLHTATIINTNLNLFIKRTMDGVRNSKSEYFLFLNPDNKKTVGIGALRNRSLNEIKHLVEMRHIIVEKDFRNRGYSHLIVQELVNEAKNQGYKKIFATTRKENVYMQRSLKRNGFEMEGSLRSHYGIGRDLTMWGKLL